MPYNGSGTFTLIDTLANATTGDADEVNTIFQDLADGLTASVAKNGESTMTGPLKASNGSAAAPSYTWGSDTDIGFYRIGANSVGLSIGGVLLVTFDSNGITLASGDVLGTAIIKTAAYEDNSVTLAKLATQGNGTILSNISGSAAAPAANSLSAIIDASFGSTQGQIIYRNNTQWTVLATGTSGQFLKTNGAAANPSWGTVIQSPDPASNTNKVVTSDGTNSSYSHGPAVRASAYISNAGAGTIASGSFNVATCTKNATGDYSIAYTTALANAGAPAITPVGTLAAWYLISTSTTGFRVQFTNFGAAALDVTGFSFVVGAGQ